MRKQTDNLAMPVTVTLELPFCQIACWVVDDKLAQMKFLSSFIAPVPPTSSLTQQIQQEFHCYLQNPQHRFSLPYHLVGTPYQQKVWALLQAIPCGKMATYGELAKKLTSSPRAVGNACRNNPLPIIVPCHRVKGKTSVGGFCGHETGLFIDIKHQLISHEAHFATH